MKRPYLTELDRIHIKYDTSVGAFRMFHFRLRQLERGILRKLKLI